MFIVNSDNLAESLDRNMKYMNFNEKRVYLNEWSKLELKL